MLPKFFMTKIIKNEKIYINVYIYFSLIIILFININSIEHFKSFNLLSNDNIVLISNEGIKKYDPSTQSEILIQSTNSISSNDDLKYVAFTQFPLDDGGYIICRLNDYIYVFDETLETYYGNFQIANIQIFIVN